MYYITSDNLDQQKQLQLQFSTKNGFYLVPAKHYYFISEMMSTICFEYFQNKIPLIVQKIKQLVLNSFSSIYSLSTFRQIIKLLKTSHQDVKTLKNYMIEMNNAFEDQTIAIDSQNLQIDHLLNQELFEKALKGQTYSPSYLDQFQLPICSEIEEKVQEQQTKTEKTMQSDLCSTKNIQCGQININTCSSKFSNFFASLVYNRDEWKTDRKGQQTQRRQNSQQLSSFDKKGSTILDTNKDLSNILQKQIQYDLTREIHLAKQNENKEHIQKQKYKYLKKIKDTIVMNKLKLKRRK